MTPRRASSTEHAFEDAVRALRHAPAGFEADYWRRGAELGWTSLLVDEAHGGGSFGDHGLVDLTLVAHEFGRRAAPGPLAPTNIVAATLERGPHRRVAPSVLAGLLAGTSIATWCCGEPPPTKASATSPSRSRSPGDELVLQGVKRPVESANRADHLLVTGRTGSGLTQVLVPSDAPGVSIEPMHTVDLTRRFSTVTFEGVRVPADRRRRRGRRGRRRRSSGSSCARS